MFAFNKHPSEFQTQLKRHIIGLRHGRNEIYLYLFSYQLTNFLTHSISMRSPSCQYCATGMVSIFCVFVLAALVQ